LFSESSLYGASRLILFPLFATGHISSIGGKFTAGVVERCTLSCEYPRKFSKRFEMTFKLFSEAWGKMVHEKT
jgi:hypothetical protein